MYLAITPPVLDFTMRGFCTGCPGQLAQFAYRFLHFEERFRPDAHADKHGTLGSILSPLFERRLGRFVRSPYHSRLFIKRPESSFG